MGLGYCSLVVSGRFFFFLPFVGENLRIASVPLGKSSSPFSSSYSSFFDAVIALSLVPSFWWVVSLCLFDVCVLFIAMVLFPFVVFGRSLGRFFFGFCVVLLEEGY